MIKYAIHVMEQTYGGYHGIEDFIVDDFESYEDACECAREASLGLMDNYGILDDSEIAEEAIMEGIEEDSDEFYDYITERREDNIDFGLWKIKDGVKESNADLQNKFWNNKDDFVKTYCENF